VLEAMSTNELSLVLVRLQNGVT